MDPKPCNRSESTNLYPRSLGTIGIVSQSSLSAFKLIICLVIDRRSLKSFDESKIVAYIIFENPNNFNRRSIGLGNQNPDQFNPWQVANNLLQWYELVYHLILSCRPILTSGEFSLRDYSKPSKMREAPCSNRKYRPSMLLYSKTNSY